MEKKIIKILIITIILFFVINFSIDLLTKNFFSADYLYVPFPVKANLCDSSFEYPCKSNIVLWGILASIIYWIIMILLIHNIVSKTNRLNSSSGANA